MARTRRRVPLNQLWKVKPPEESSTKEVLPDELPVVIVPDVAVQEESSSEVVMEPAASTEPAPSQGIRPSLFWGQAVIMPPKIAINRYAGGWG